MTQMLDMIKSNSVPEAVMRSAAKGSLPVPTSETLQILVHMTGNAIFGEEAALTLAGWDEESTRGVLSSQDAPREVLEYFLNPKNHRSTLMSTIISNPQVSDQQLAQLAAGASRQLIEILLASARVKTVPSVAHILLANPHVSEPEARQLREELGEEALQPPDPESQAAHETWEKEHANEIKAEEGKTFELIGGQEGSNETSTSASAAATPAASTTAVAQKTSPDSSSGALKVSTLVKLSRMNVADRVKRGFLGSKEERAILIRDSAKVVQSAVIASPKVSEAEIETFAAAKNVSENVLREIIRNRRYLKIYSVVRNLVNNPKCPLDLSLTLVKNLLVTDLKTLSGNKNVPDTLRKVALKLFKEKQTPVGQKPE